MEIEEIKEKEMKAEASERMEMTAEDWKDFKAFKAEKEKRRQQEERKRQRENYAALVDEEIAAAIPELKALSEQIKTVKNTVLGNFKTVLDMKAELFGLKGNGQFSHTFTNGESTMRIVIGMNTVDGYRDTVEDGISLVRSYIESLATDAKSQALVNAILRLLSRDAAGNLKASRVLQLRKMAEESGNERFIEGVGIIEESYQPTETRCYIRAQYRDESTGNAWRSIPLGITDVDI